MTQTFDAIIIGGGIMGCSAAFQLARRGLKVALLEKDTIGAGPTGKSSAIIRQHYSNELTARMALHSLRVFQNFDDAVGGEIGFTDAGFAVLVSDEDKAGLETNIALQRKVGIKTGLISPQELSERVPGLKISDLCTAAYEPESGYADPYLTVNAYASAARRYGAQIFQDTEVIDIRLEKGGLVTVNATTDTFSAPLALNSAGAWGARVAKMAGVDVPINSCRVQVAFFRRPAGYEAPHPVIGDFIHATYFRSETGGLTLSGLIDPAEADAIVNPDKYNEDLDTDFVLNVGERLLRRYPPLEQSQSTGGYASLYAITPDWHPIVDELLPDSGFYIASGFSGHGFKLGPAMGVMIADLLTDVSQPEFDPAMFRLKRYAEGAAVQGQYEYSIAG